MGSRHEVEQVSKNDDAPSIRGARGRSLRCPLALDPRTLPAVPDATVSWLGRRAGFWLPRRSRRCIATGLWWPVTLDVSVGGVDARWITGHVLAAQPSWVRGRPTTFGETASFWSELYTVEIKASP